jgi:hypothetical protein
MSNPYIGPWRNTEPCFKAAMYIQMCRPEELKEWSPKLYALIIKFGSAFDDTWEYWLNKRMTWIRRTPLGYGKRIPCEKPKRYEPNQKLEIFNIMIKGAE